MTSPDLSGLIERVESASGPDRELDCLIAVAASKEPTARVAYMAGRRWYKKPGAGRIPFAGAFGSGAALGMIFQDRRYTASLDAAMTLVPNDPCVGWEVSDGAGGPTARIWYVDIDRADDWEVGASPLATPALALVAASLRAQKEQANG